MSLQGVPPSQPKALEILSQLSEEIAPKDDGKIPKLYLRVVREEGGEQRAEFKKKTAWRRIKIFFNPDKSSYMLGENVPFITKLFKSAFEDILGQEAPRNIDVGTSQNVETFEKSGQIFNDFFQSIDKKTIDFDPIRIAKEAAREFLRTSTIADPEGVIDTATTIGDVIDAVRRLRVKSEKGAECSQRYKAAERLQEDVERHVVGDQSWRSTSTAKLREIGNMPTETEDDIIQKSEHLNTWNDDVQQQIDNYVQEQKNSLQQSFKHRKRPLSPELLEQINGMASLNDLEETIFQVQGWVKTDFLTYQAGVEDQERVKGHLKDLLKLNGQDLAQHLEEEFSAEQLMQWLSDEQVYENAVQSDFRDMEREALTSTLIVCKQLMSTPGLGRIKQQIDTAIASKDLEGMERVLKDSSLHREFIRASTRRAQIFCAKVGLLLPSKVELLSKSCDIHRLVKAFQYIEKFVKIYEPAYMQKESCKKIKNDVQSILNDICSERCTMEDALKIVEDLVSGAPEGRVRNIDLAGEGQIDGELARFEEAPYFLKFPTSVGSKSMLAKADVLRVLKGIDKEYGTTENQKNLAEILQEFCDDKIDEDAAWFYAKNA